MRGLVLGTAGHIDHGKTALVRALTGIDTDRLPEEKTRGISIDLGFAHVTLPGGERISFVDVPGHERFIKNMLAGAGGIEAVVLVVAANESIKPQTREHFDICRLLGIQRGLVVLTKSDLAEPAQLRSVVSDVRKLCEGSFLAAAPILPVSAVTGSGLDELKQQLASLAREATRRDGDGIARLPIDRSFAVKGFGTVVTGTLWSGTLRTGETVEIHPTKRQARIRGLQVHGKQVEMAMAGDRTAVNLAGVDHSEIRRGCVLAPPQLLEPTVTIDATIDWLTGAEIPLKRQEFLLHIGTAEVVASLKMWNVPSPFARLHLAQPVLALPGDRFVLRRMSPAQTVAGGCVIDAFPPKRLSRAKATDRFGLLAGAGVDRRIQILVEAARNGLRVEDLVRLTGLPSDALVQAIRKNPDLVVNAPFVLAKSWIEQRRAKLVSWLQDFHATHPAAEGAPLAQARLGLDANLSHVLFENFPALRLQGETIALAEHRPRVSNQESALLHEVDRRFQQAGFQPPPLDGIPRPTLETLIKAQKLVRVSADLVFHSAAIAGLRESLASRKGRRFSVPEFKSWTNISRKYAIPLLEYLDRQHVTRRDGDARVVL
ncbi:MAG TPA: selenocysteine-specific translation elongation factor [Bryobacteraceae bacterium]|nr:selenocysteine-specific translation elongation factor [Bryobacteraceae bacterium]